ncbi:MAG: sigma-70 family RNA polymerase sigma factor [Planctomycetota bacterium]
MQDQPTLEELFERFRRSGDSAALAAVFDAAAPRLLLVAAHVTPDPGAAEDLVQETFLAAMDKAEQWHGDRPLLPWLAGILRHRALDLGRRLKLRRPTAPSELVDQAIAEAGDPGAHAEASELLERIDEALESLTSPFREALVLRLVHGLEPTAIAHALGRPPATVRVQLKRGLARLRKSLPAGIAGALASLLLPGVGMAAVRQTVLGAAKGAGEASESPAGGLAESQAAGVVAQSRRAAWLAAGLVVAGLAWGVAELVGGSTAAPAVADATSGLSPGRTEPLADDLSPAPSAGPGRASKLAGATTPAATDATTTLRGRLVGAVDGLPIAAARATLSFGRGRFMTRDPSFRAYPDPVAVDADAAGNFALTWTPSQSMRVSLHVAAPGHVPATARWTSVRNGIDFDLGDVELQPGARVTMSCLDEQGQPVAGVTLSLAKRSRDVEASTSMFDALTSFTETGDALGQLIVENVPAPATYEVSVAARTGEPWRVVGGEQLVVSGIRGAAVHRVVLAPEPSRARRNISGLVLDATGAPVPDLWIQLHPDEVYSDRAKTDANGRFALEHSYPDRPQELHLARTERRYRMLEPKRRYPSGDSKLVVRVAKQALQDVAIEVVDARSGRPVERFGYRFEHDYWGDKQSWAIPPDRFYWPADPETHAGGRAVIPQLPVGRYRLSVHPESSELAIVYMQTFEVGSSRAASEPVRVALPGFAPLTVRVRSSVGQPVAGEKVRLVHLMASDRWSSLFSLEQLRHGIGGGRKMAVALQEVQTDAKGLCRLRAPIDESRLVLVTGGMGAMGQRHELGAVAAEGRTIDLEVPATAVVRGTLGPAELLAGIRPPPEELAIDAIVRPEDSEIANSLAKLRLVGADGSRGGECVVRPDGTFVFGAAKIGAWSLELDFEWRQGGSAAYTRSGEKLTDIATLAAGEQREIAVDAGHLMPARLIGSVVVDGAPWVRDGFGLLASNVKRRHPEKIELTATGAFDASVRPGRYLPYVRWKGPGRSVHYQFASERLRLASRRTDQAAVAMQRRSVRLVVVGADGKPAPKQLVELRLPDFPEAERMARTKYPMVEGGEGESIVTIDPAPPGRIEVLLPAGADGGQAILIATVGAKVGVGVESAESGTVSIQLPF